MRIPAVLFASALAFITYSLHARATDAPAGWVLSGEAPQLFAAEETHSPSGHAVTLRRVETSHPYGQAMLLKEFPAAQYAGKEIRLHHKIRTDVTDRNQYGIGVESLNLGTHTIVPPRECRDNKCVEGDVLVLLPRDLKHLRAGIWLKGQGAVMLESISIEVLGDAPPDLKSLVLKSTLPERTRDDSLLER